MSKIIKVIFLFLLFAVNCTAQNKLWFEKEDITFEIKDSTFIVNGLYYFNSTSEDKFSVLYPFPTDSIFGKPTGICVSYVNSGQSIDYKTAKDFSSIVFQIFADLQQPILISYHQQLKSNIARYILLTTNYWQKPLKQVDYKLVTDLNFSINSFSIHPDKEIQIENKKIYLWHKDNYTPLKDFIIEF